MLLEIGTERALQRVELGILLAEWPKERLVVEEPLVVRCNVERAHAIPIEMELAIFVLANAQPPHLAMLHTD